MQLIKATAFRISRPRGLLELDMQIHYSWACGLWVFVLDSRSSLLGTILLVLTSVSIPLIQFGRMN